MSASEKLRALKETGFTCEHWTDFDASDLDVTDELIAVVEEAERVRDLWGGYAGDPAQAIQRSEVRLRKVLAALDDAL